MSNGARYQSDKSCIKFLVCFGFEDDNTVMNIWKVVVGKILVFNA